MYKGLSVLITAFLFNLFASFSAQAAVTIYTDYNAWLSAVNASSQNLQVSHFETNYNNVSNEKFVGSFSQLPSSSAANYNTTRTNINFDGNNVSLGRHATFDSSDTGFDLSFEISATESVSGQGDAYIYYNDIPQGKSAAEVDAFTDVLSIGKFNGFDAGDGSQYHWDNDDFTLEITSAHQVYAVSFKLINNKQNTTESLEVFANKTSTGSSAFDSSDGQNLAIFNNGSIPGYTGSYSSNYDDERFVGIVSTTPFSWLEFDEGDSVNDIGISDLRFATPNVVLKRLEINQIGSGSASFSTNPTGNSCNTSADHCFDFNANTSVSITAQAASSNDQFVSWSGCDSSNALVCTVSLNTSKTVSARFEQDNDHDGHFDPDDNCPQQANPSQANTDGDAAGNVCDDFPTNAQETQDSDSDGMGDNFETTYNFNLQSSADAHIDTDGDNYSNLEEFLAGTHPRNFSSNPAPDTDSDGHKDGFDNCPLVANPGQTDSDGDNVGNLCDAFPNNANESQDSDGDGLGDNFERQHGFNPNNSQDATLDSDDDGLTNIEEYNNGTDPNNIHDPEKKATIFWRNIATGTNFVYLLDSFNILRSQFLNTADLGWETVATADFNGDGEKDILWRNKRTGSNWIYLMKNAHIQYSRALNTVSNQDWKVIGSADFNGDGKDDILWRNVATGEVWMYLLNETTIIASTHVALASLDWQIKGTGDFNGDGKSDIVWQNISSGYSWMYLMNGANIVKSEYVSTTSTSWHIVGTGDFNNDGKDDILWQNQQTGMNWIYQMNGTQISHQGLLNTVADLNWQIVQVEDLNHDNRADVLWRNKSTGSNWVYLLNGLSIQQSRALNSVADTHWKIVPGQEQ